MGKSGRRIGTMALAILLSMLCAGVFLPNRAAAASDDDAILEGVYMGEMSLAGMTAEEAKASVGAFVEELKQKNITFGAVGDHYVSVMAGDLGLTWVNESDIDAAAALGITMQRLVETLCTKPCRI